MSVLSSLAIVSNKGLKVILSVVLTVVHSSKSRSLFNKSEFDQNDNKLV